MTIKEVEKLLNTLSPDESSWEPWTIRVAVVVDEDEAISLMDYVKSIGYFGMLRRSDFGDIELVITDGNTGFTRDKA